MVCDPSQIETKDLRLCPACQAEPHDRDKFCRRCGARLDEPNIGRAVSIGFSARGISPLPEHNYHRVSCPLVAAVTAGISTNTGQTQSRLAKRLISALISIPIWLIIVLLSPFDAYATAKTIS